MRTLFSAAALLGLAACGDPGSTADEALDAAGEAADRIPCAVEGETGFEQVCTVERLTGDEGPILTIRHPSGGFRRFLLTSDGRGVIAADGAVAAVVSVIADDRIEVAVDGDRYRLPATVKASRQEP
ncbi:hypothetical protein [Allosphingosinicella sp.]|uniref:hypothetical protein n=1 Tax=Allosphingosinicella sp. TaxID=2823234 RepID=UPI002FC0B62B